jgi:two-component system, NarL family, response regulator LiaR
MTFMPIRLAIVNDYEVVVRGVAGMLQTEHDLFSVVELDSGVLPQQDVDIALYDSFAPSESDGPDVMSLLDHPLVSKVVVYTWSAQQRLIDKALERGVAGYLTKQMRAEELRDALRRIHHGEVVVAPAGEVESPTNGSWPGREEGLTPREAEVIALITRGLSNQEIAEKTCLSINSVKSYIRTSYRKVGIASRTNAVLWGLEHGFDSQRVRVANPDMS